MRQIKSQMLPFERMTKEPEHNFFGYYDLQPWSGDGRYHLCNRVSFMDRMQTQSDRAELGMIRTGDGQFIPLASTYAWNFQQGAMLQWNPVKPDEEIIYNCHLRDSFKCAVKNIVTGDTRLLPRPLANLSQDGRHGLSVNFSRMFDFRPGYGYAGIADPYLNTPSPEEDGIYLIDMGNAMEKLIIPMPALSEIFSKKFGSKNPKILVNHITFNPSGDRFLCIVRNMPMPGTKSDGWASLVISSDLAGKNIHVLNGFGGASHYIWRDPEHILIYADLPGPGKMALCLARDLSQEYEILEPGFFSFDGHCSYSPDKNFILYDSYPDTDGYRKLLLYDIKRKKGLLLAELFSAKREYMPYEDIRCDLHPRWNRDGSAISFDSIHEAHRHVYWMELKEILT
ncbi:MAG: hypothetical protein A2X49_10605 [Lentisphaerae bacterium GWF2_52_8]|nr:MAG: hypothetical protein A2X49_10605 [Lentisphaerae bacterium GWF2_52_8]